MQSQKISVVKIRRLLREQHELKIPQESDFLLSEEAEAVPGGIENTRRSSRVDVALVPFRVQAKYFDEAV